MKLTDMLRGKIKESVEEPVEVSEEQSSMATYSENVQLIALNEIETNPYQPRIEFAESGLQELADSIREHGVLHPVVVRRRDDRFELVVGERRLRACRLLGWDQIPAIVRDMTNKAAAEMALIENLQRRDLAFFEEAEGYRNLIDEFGLTQEELARRLGKGQSTVANKMRLLRLPVEVRGIISREILTERHARTLLRLDSETDQIEVANLIIAKELNVKETEKLVNRWIEQKKENTKKKQTRKLVFKDVRLFSNSLKKLTETLSSSGLDVEMQEEDSDEYYTVVVQIRKPEGRET